MVTKNRPKSVGIIVGRDSEMEVSVNVILHVVKFEQRTISYAC